MAYVQSASNGTTPDANVTSLTCAFTNSNIASSCLLVDVIWKAAAGASGTLSVSDSAGNSYSQIFTRAGSGAAAGLNFTSWVAPGCAGAANTVTATFTGTGSIADLVMSIHEYAQIVSVSPVHVFADTTFLSTDSRITGVTTTTPLTILHAFACNRFATAIVLNPDDPLDNAGFMPRESIPVGTYAEGMLTCDRPVSVTASYGASFFGNRLALTSMAAAMIALVVVPSPLASNVNTEFSPAKPWLVINEPSIGLTNRSSYLHFDNASSHSWTQVLRQRGTAQIPLHIRDGDSYMPTIGSQVYLYDQNVSGATMVFAGTIDRKPTVWRGNAGDRVVTISVVSFEQTLDALLIPPQAFYVTAAEDILTSLFNSIAGGVPITLGTISASFIVNSVTYSWDNLWESFQNLATAASCICGIDLATLTLYIKPPSTTAAPYALTTAQIAWESSQYDENRQDYRNRQIVRISLDAFADSDELFTFSGVPATFQLARAAQTVVAAYITKNTQNTGTLTFSDQPTAGDTVTIGYPQTGSIFNWAPHAPYQAGQIIIDPANHVQACTTAGTSGSSQPAWNDSGGTTSDGSVVWTDRGLSGPGGLGASIYTFVDSLADYSGATGVWPVSAGNPSGQMPTNAQWGFVLIGPTVGATAQNLQDAINRTDGVDGQAYSWPTWENPIVNASGVDPSSSTPQVTVKSKHAGKDYIATTLATSAGSTFSWAASQTSGGITTGGTTQLQVAAQGSSNTANIYYTPGSNVVSIASLPSGASGSYVQIQYQRAAGDCIVGEDSYQVNVRAAIENGTGKYQKLLSQTSITSNTLGLQTMQAALAAYVTIPTQFTFRDWKPGLLPGQLLDITQSDIPVGIHAIFPNGNYLIQEVTGEMMPTQPYLDPLSVPGGGHYQYTVTVINTNQIQSFLEFWQQMGSGGSGGGSAIVGAGGLTPGGGQRSPSGIFSMGTTGNLVPSAGPEWFQECGPLTGNITIKPPAVPVAGDSYMILIFVGAAAHTITWDSFYKGVGTLVVDQSAANQVTAVLVRVNAAATSAQATLIGNGTPTT